MNRIATLVDRKDTKHCVEDGRKRTVVKIVSATDSGQVPAGFDSAPSIRYEIQTIVVEESIIDRRDELLVNDDSVFRIGVESS